MDMKKGSLVVLLVAMGSFAASAATMTIELVTAAHEKVSITRTFEVKDGKARFVLPRAEIPAGVKSVALKPDFARAKTGEDGYWVLSNNMLGRFRETDGILREGWHVPMPIYGMKTPRGAFCAIVTGMPYSLTFVVEAKKGDYCVYAMFDRFMDDVYEDIAVEYTFLTGDDADYSGMARHYRAYQLKRGACQPIAERIKEQPLLEYAAKYPEARIRQAWKQVPSPYPDQVTRNEPPVKPVVTFDRVKEIVDECEKQGVGGVEFCLVGWNVGGHDGRFPQIFPVEPTLGGEAKLKECVKYTQEKGYQIVGHSTFRDCYMIADTWDSEYVVEKNPDGTLKRGTVTWGGGRLYTMCPQRSYEKFCPKQCAEMATLGFKGLFYVDVVTSRPLFPCTDRRHPLNNGERAVWEANILNELRRAFGGSASEGAFDFCIGALDSAMTVQFHEPFQKAANPLVDEYVPLWQLVYNGIVLATPFRTMINCTANPDRRYLLKLAEFGGRPLYYWHSNFLTGQPSFLGRIDLEATTDEKMRQGVAHLKKGCDEYARRSDLQFHFMDKHETPAPGVVRVTYSNGAKMLVNYNDKPVSVDGREVPAMDYVVVR